MRIPAQVLLTVLVLVCLSPFFGKAFHADDTLFVWVGQQIAQHPGDPYGFSVTWYSVPQHMWEVTKNPPIASYYLAAAGRIFGWSEKALHAAFFLPALAVILGTYSLARRLTRLPLLAATATLAAPGFLVSSTSVMCDTLMVAVWILAILLWMKGLDQTWPALVALSGLLIAVCALTKYFGIALIPLLLVYSLVRQRRVGGWIVYLLLPAVALAGYQYWTKMHYGAGLVGSAAEYAQARDGVSQASVGRVYKTLVGLSFAGGCALPALTFAPLVWSGRLMLLGGAAAGLAGFLLGVGVFGGFLNLQLALFIAGGVSVLALAVSDWRHRRDANSVLLLAWVLGTFVFASFVNWTVNARSVLPMVPAVGILLARRMEVAGGLTGELPRLTRLIAPLVVSGAVALWVTWADASLANSARLAAQYVRDRWSSPAVKVSFEGHWGFQYYMQAFGFSPVNHQDFRFRNGDLLVVPDNNTNTSTQSVISPIVASQESFSFPMKIGVTTMSIARGAGFYTDTWGPMPYAFGSPPSEGYTVFRLRKPGKSARISEDSQIPPA